MGATIEKHISQAAFEPENFINPPFFVRHSRLGYFIFAVCLLAFGVLTWQVLVNGPLVRGDLGIATQVHAWATHEPQILVLVMRFFSAFGREGVGLVILVLLVFWMIKKSERELSFLVMGLMGSELCFQLSSSLIGRDRPSFRDPFESLLGSGFPSGHAATNLVMVWMLLYLLLPVMKSPLRKALLVGGSVLYVALVCASRLFLGLHFPTDLIAGLLLGAAWAALVFTAFDVYWWKRRTGTARLPLIKNPQEDG